MSLRVPILMYHSVSERSSGRFAPFAVRPAEFSAQIAAIQAGGFATLTVSELAACYSGRMRLPAKPIVLTFDDGFADFLDGALPALAAAGMVATVYAVAGLVGRTSNWLDGIGEGGRPLMDWSDLAALGRNRIEIGAHSLTHPQLDALSAAECREQVHGSKAALEHGLGREVETFAYPFGFEGRRVRDIVREAGLSSACAVRYATSQAGDDVFRLPRHIVRRGTDLQAFTRIVLDQVPALPLVVDRARSRSFAAVRSLIRSVHA